MLFVFQSLRDIDEDLEPAKATDDLDTVIEMMKEPEDKMPPEDVVFLNKAGTCLCFRVSETLIKI